MTDRQDKLRAGILGQNRKQPDDLFRATTTESRGATIPPQMVEGRQSKTEAFSARVTLPLSREQKRFLDQLAGQIQGDNPAEPINRNTILRALTSALMELSLVTSADRVNSEGDLLKLVSARILGGTKK